MLEKITTIDQKDKVQCVVLSHKLLSTKIYYPSIDIFFILFISRQVQKCKNYETSTSTSKDTCKTVYIILFKLFSIGNSLNLKRLKKHE